MLELAKPALDVGLYTNQLDAQHPRSHSARCAYRYMTVQVFDVVSAHQAIVSAGGGEGMQPVHLGDVAYISFVLDPGGNWLEISQRKSITGSLE